MLGSSRGNLRQLYLVRRLHTPGCSRLVLACLFGIGVLFSVIEPSERINAQDSPKEEIYAIYTRAQAAEGKVAYQKNCAQCHGENVDDGEFGTPLKGLDFAEGWAGKSAGALMIFMKANMPPANPGGLEDKKYAQIVAYLLQENGLQPGESELPPDIKSLGPMILLRGSAMPAGTLSPALSPFAERPPAVSISNRLNKLTPVTDEMLSNPRPGEWLTWRRTYDALGFSPLKQINRDNVADLHVAWAFSLPGGPNEETPLVHDGVLFIEGFGDKVQAIDAVTGNMLWQYSRQLPENVNKEPKRNLAIYGERLLVPTSDAHLVALDVKTGGVIWDRVMADYEHGARITGGPLVVKGKVLQGTSGRGLGGNYIVAVDIETGKEIWRFNTIAGPGQPGADSWNGMPFETRSGASVWTAGSYDPELNLAYFGTAQTYDTGPLLHPVDQPGITNDALYTDTTLALNPDTGKLVWYFQHLPNDQWDFDWAFDQQLVKLPIGGVMRKTVITAGKPGLFDAMDAATGKYAFSFDSGLQNLVIGINPQTGAKTINPEVIPDGRVHLVCPSMTGARSWMPLSYNPETKILYSPLTESCMDIIPVAPGSHAFLSAGVRWGLRARPGSDGKFGRVQALNLETRKIVWADRRRAPQTSGVLATAGGVVFSGSYDRKFRAYDDSNGKLLWEEGLDDVPTAAPITYSVNGRQYLAVVVGNGNAHASSWPPLVPEIHNPPDHGAAIWVFELPEKDLTREKGPH